MSDPSTYDVFLSHNSADKEAVELLARRLREEARLNPFLDQWHLVPGEPWQAAVEEALDCSTTVAVFVGPSGVSPWLNVALRAAATSPYTVTFPPIIHWDSKSMTASNVNDKNVPDVNPYLRREYREGWSL